MSDAQALERTDTETEGRGAGLRVPFPAPAAQLGASSRRRLTTLLLAKLTLDLLFVCALAVYAHSVSFHPFFSGSLDSADSSGVRGWVVDRARASEAVEVQLYLDGQFVADSFADQPRPDVAAKGYAPDERHGYVFALGTLAAGTHEARVYAVHASRADSRRTLQQIGAAYRFTVK